MNVELDVHPVNVVPVGQAGLHVKQFARTNDRTRPDRAGCWGLSVEQESAQSQRRLAAELGNAIGLVNAYLKRRYVYYLMPQGFAEKSRTAPRCCRRRGRGVPMTS